MYGHLRPIVDPITWLPEFACGHMYGVSYDQARLYMAAGGHIRPVHFRCTYHPQNVYKVPIFYRIKSALGIISLSLVVALVT
jgi:hypothetical protein